MADGTRSDSKKWDADRWVDLRFSLVGGGVAALAVFAGVAIVGRISPGEGIGLLSSVMPTVRFFAAGAMGAAATVLALMLTILGFTYRSDYEFNRGHYRRISQIALLTTSVIIVSVITLVALGLPVEQADELRLYHHVIYYALVATGSILGGLMVSVALMLNRTVRGLVAIAHPEGESFLVESTAQPKSESV